jgi:hypothetical protein
MYQPGPRRRDEQIRRGEMPGQPFGGIEGGNCIGVPAACQLELAAEVLDLCVPRISSVAVASGVALYAVRP